LIGIRIAMVIAYAVFILFAIGVIVASVWLVQQGIGTAVSLIPTPVPTELPLALEPTEPIATAEPIASGPTLTPTPVQTPTPTPDPLCIPSAQAKANTGKTLCVQGVVVRTYASQTAFFVEFDQPGTGFFGTVLNPAAPLTNLVGKCVQLKGAILNYQGRPYIVFNPDQMQSCPNP
jgi:hypothetical protein